MLLFVLCAVLIFIQGHGAPEQEDPHHLLRDGIRVQPQTAVPRESEEWRQFAPEYEQIKEAFGPIFEWIGEQVMAPFSQP